MELKELLVQVVLLVQVEVQVHQVRLVPQVLKRFIRLKEQLVLKVMQVLKGMLVQAVRLAVQVHQVSQV
tara:strand:- start:981 stop:1187 length:207 start_codon:yes stop_codon:yes gene_type:complete